MPDYQNGKIYCIRSHQTDKVYVGSTTQALSMRMCGHRKSCKQFKQNGKIRYVTSFDILEYDDAYIELIEDFVCDNKSQLERREGHFIREMDCVNKLIAGRTDKEYREDNKDKIKEYSEANKDKISDYNKERYESNKDIIKEKVKEWGEANKDKVRQYKKKYEQANKDKINQQRRERYLKKKQESNSI